LEYCSESPPAAGVYLATTATKLSANVLIEAVRLLKVDELEEYVPVLMFGIKVEKNGCDMDEIVIDP
jgi:hypothetical protein